MEALSLMISPLPTCPGCFPQGHCWLEVMLAEFSSLLLGLSEKIVNTGPVGPDSWQLGHLNTELFQKADRKKAVQIKQHQPTAFRAEN